jgi:molybdenum cofactor cytidylyltransferase
MDVFILSDIQIPCRDVTYRDPAGPHVVVSRGSEIEDALGHLKARADCNGLAVVGLPKEIPGLEALSGRRLLLCDSDGPRIRAFAKAALDAGAAVEWIKSKPIPVDRLAAWALPVGGIVLAAGAGTRMGSNKLLLDVGGQALVRHAITAASEGGCHLVVVVYSDDSVREVVGDAARAVFNPEAASGMASSLRAGLAAMPDWIAGAVVLLGDQPLVGGASVEVLLRTWRRQDARPAVAAAYPGKAWRPPVVLARALWPELMALEGDAGARQVLDRDPELLDTVRAGGRPDDVDTPEDYANIVRLFPADRRDPR